MSGLAGGLILAGGSVAAASPLLPWMNLSAAFGSIPAGSVDGTTWLRGDAVALLGMVTLCLWLCAGRRRHHSSATSASMLVGAAGLSVATLGLWVLHDQQRWAEQATAAGWVLAPSMGLWAAMCGGVAVCFGAVAAMRVHLRDVANALD